MLVMTALASGKTWHLKLSSPVAAGSRGPARPLEAKAGGGEEPHMGGRQDQSTLWAMCWVVNLIVSSSRTRGERALDPGSGGILTSHPRFGRRSARVGESRSQDRESIWPREHVSHTVV